MVCHRDKCFTLPNRTHHVLIFLISLCSRIISSKLSDCNPFGVNRSGEWLKKSFNLWHCMLPGRVDLPGVVTLSVACLATPPLTAQPTFLTVAKTFFSADNAWHIDLTTRVLQNTVDNLSIIWWSVFDRVRRFQLHPSYWKCLTTL